MLIWERDHEWVVHRTRHHLELLIVVLSPGPVDAVTLKSLRSLREELRQMSPADLKSLVGSSGRFQLGTFGSIEAKSIVQQAAKLGLRVDIVDKSFVSYLPEDRTTKSILLIEDDLEAERVALEMIAAGALIEEAESD